MKSTLFLCLTCLLVISFAGAPIATAQSVLLELNFDNASDRLANTGTSTTTFSNVGGVTFDSGVNSGTAAVFNGSSYLQANASPLTTAFSITFWLKTSATAPDGGQWYQGAGIIDGEVGGDTNDWGISQTGSMLAFGIGSSDATLKSTSTINSGAWIYVAATWDSGTGVGSLYLNGTLEASQSNMSTVARRTDQPFFIGQDLSGQHFNGTLDQIQVYDSVLTVQQINNLQATGSAVPEPSTFAVLAGAFVLGWAVYRRRRSV